MLELSFLKIISTEPEKSPYPASPYIAKLELQSRSIVLLHTEVVQLHEYVKQLCPQRFAWWCPLPPELWVDNLIYRNDPPLLSALPEQQAMRIDILANKQFSSSLDMLLTPGQLITLRKIAYRIRSDWEEYALTKTSYRGM